MALKDIDILMMEMEGDLIINAAEKLCKKFIDKVESGKARSKETYSDCKELYKLIQKYKKDI